MSDIENDVQENEVFIEDEQEEELEHEEELPSEEETESEEKPEVLEAKKYGHMSREEWVAAGKDPNKWKSPEQFNETGKILEQVYSMKKQLEQRDRELKAVLKYQESTAQREYERAKQELQQRIAASKDDFDMDGVAQYTKELVSLEQNETQNHIQRSQQMQQQAKDSFIERNQHWFNDRNPDLMQRAIDIDEEIKHDIESGRLRINSYDEIGTMIEKRLSYEYPERVLGQSKPKPVAVSRSTSSVNKSAASSNSADREFKSLSQDHKDTYEVYKRVMNPNITKAEFIARLKKDGELK